MKGLFTSQSTKRIYVLIKSEGKDKLTCRVDGEWANDSVCDRVNTLLAEGIVSPDTVNDWILINHTDAVPH